MCLQKVIGALLAFSMLLLSGCTVADAAANKEASGVAEPSITSDQEVSKAEELSAMSDQGKYSMVIAKLPSPPVCKKIQDKAAMDKILHYIDAADKVPLEKKRQGGWYFLINVSEPGEDSYQISCCANLLVVKGVDYQVSDGFQDGLEAIYNEIPVKETKYPER